MTARILGFICAVLISLTFTPGVFAQAKSQAEASEKLKDLNEKIGAEEAEFNEIKRSYDKLVDESNRTLDELTDIRNQRVELEEQLRQGEQKKKQITEQIGFNERSIASQRSNTGRRLTALYRSTVSQQNFNLFLSAASVDDISKRVVYLRRVAAYDAKYLTGLRSLTEKLEDDRHELDRVEAEMAQFSESLKDGERRLAERAANKERLAKEMEEKLKQRETLLAKLRASATELEAVLDNFTGGSGSGDFKGPPLKVASLGYPVDGEIVQKFGKQKHEQFSDMLFVKGLEFAVPVGEKVRSVRDGKVVLSQVLPGYGHLVIVDHGSRCYSLYGRLASSLVAIGATVKQSDVIGIVGQADERGRNFYFELRLKGKPVDPATYFKTKAIT